MSVSLPILERPQQVQGSVWDYISPSRLNCWLSCPLKFRCRYVDGIKTPTTPALFLGQRCHFGLEIYYRHQMLGVTLATDDVVMRMNETWEEATVEQGMTFENQSKEALLRQQAADLVVAYLKQVLPDEPRPMAVEARMEVPLVDPGTGEDLGIPLLGIADLILNGDEGADIVDFKTSSRSAPPFEISHEIQLTSYAYLFRRTTGQEEVGLEIHSLIKTKSPKIVLHRYPARDDAHFQRLLAVIREYLDALDTGRFNFRPGLGCSMCDFRDTHCRAWGG